MSQCSDCSTDRAISTERRLARMETKLETIDEKLDDAILTQLKDHGKRIVSLENKGAWNAGWMAGAGFVGGSVGVAAAKFLGLMQ